MASSWLDHRKLQIVKGIGKVPGDTASAEPDPVIVNFLSGPISLETNGWSPQMPSSDGVWADSPLVDGRTLLAASAKNVTEKMSLLITDASYLVAMQALDSLNKMILDCRDFMQAQTQILPVYLVWYAGCGVGEQYALISNMDLATDYLDAPAPSIRVSLSIEREPYWRGIPPGANPKLWSYYVKTGNQAFNNTNANLLSLTDDLVYDTSVKNRLEWNAANYTSVLSRNYVDIPAASIPGDAPALVSLVASITSQSRNPQIYIGRSTKPTSVTDRTGAAFQQAYNFNAGDAVAPLNWTKTVDASCGCISNRSSVTKYLGANAALALGTYTNFARWGSDGSTRFFDFSVIRGSYAVFLRCRQLNGAAGDVQAQFVYSESVSNVVTGQYTNLPITGAVLGCANRFDLLYLGQFSTPVSSKAYSSPDGLGLNVSKRTAAGSPSFIGVNVKQNNAAARSVEFLDLILLPIDEAAIELIGAESSNQVYFHYDTTGYLSHGYPQPMAVVPSPDVNEVYENGIQVLGQDLTLTPKVNNRLYFILRLADIGGGGITGHSAPDSTNNDFLTVHINIVPRWSGIRDQ